jgi:hypothetical protein
MDIVEIPVENFHAAETVDSNIDVKTQESMPFSRSLYSEDH